MLLEAREELGRADGKASILFGALGVALGALSAGLIADDWSVFDLANSVEWIWWLGAVFIAAALVLLAAAVYPRVDNQAPREKVAYFGHVVKFGTFKEFERAVTFASRSGSDRFLDQIWAIATIVDKKYRYTRWALWCTGLGLALNGIAAVLDKLAC